MVRTDIWRKDVMVETELTNGNKLRFTLDKKVHRSMCITVALNDKNIGRLSKGTFRCFVRQMNKFVK